jgi:hypothetical protein
MTEKIEEVNNALMLKNTTMIRFNEHAAIMVKVLTSIPMHPTLRNYANMNFDQFGYWVREAIRHMPETDPTPPAELEAPTGEPVQEPTSSTES